MSKIDRSELAAPAVGSQVQRPVVPLVEKLRGTAMDCGRDDADAGLE